MVSFPKLKNPVREGNARKNAAIEEKATMGKLGTSHLDGLVASDYEQLKPILILLDCQSRKSYMWWDSTELLLQLRGATDMYAVSRLLLRGTELQILVDSEANEYDNCVVLDVANGMSGTTWRLEHSFLELDGGNITLLGRTPEALLQLRHLFDMCMLARFEYMSLYKALTATLISVVGTRISDISMLLNSNHSYKDWCHIYVNGGWVKAWCHVDKSSKSSDSQKGKRQIKFFTDDKSLSSKDLICFIPDCGDEQDLFFVPEYDGSNPGDSNLTGPISSIRDPLGCMESRLSKLTCLRLVGDVYWPSEETESSRSRSSSTSWVNRSPKKRSESTSHSSFSFSPKHRRTLSSVSVTSSVYHGNVNEGSHSITTELLIKPIPHDGVFHLESMIRCVLPMMSSLRLYGRPVQFKNSRDDINSLVFGLPRLPTIDYFAREEIQPLFEYSHKMQNQSDSYLKTVAGYKAFLQERLKDNARDKRSFTTLADVLRIENPRELAFSSSCSSTSSPLI